MRRLGLFAFLIISCVSASAQVFDLQSKGVPIAELRGPCRFHIGDDQDGKLGWATPGFNDSQWSLVRMDRPWSEQGYKSETGFAWYRFQIVAPRGQPHLAIFDPGLELSYEIFVDGQLVAKRGGLPPNQKVILYGVDPVYEIPDNLITPGRPLQIAMRVWHWPFWTFWPEGPQSPMMVGNPQLLERQRNLLIDENWRGTSGWIFLFAASVLAFFAALGLFLLRPGDYEYLWFAFSELSLASIALYFSYISNHVVEFLPWQIWNALQSLLYLICWPTFIVTFLKEPRRHLYWFAVAASVATTLSWIPFLFQWISAANWIFVLYLLLGAQSAGVVLLIWTPARRGVFDARVLLGIQFLFSFVHGLQCAIYVLATTGHYSLSVPWQTRYNAFFTWPFTFSLLAIEGFFTQSAVLVILILRFARTSRDEERHANELESARIVQQILVPAENPSIAGFVIESVYRPAGEVGGDFYQVVATESGGALVVIGDVSGKGMPAAMTVSLLVGTFRTLAHYMHSPSEILAAMNQRMQGRSNGGFTTCLVMRIDIDGTVTAANAGHIAPIVDGHECELDNGLPLGLDFGAAYAEKCFGLHAGERVTLMTDGVVEARKPSGELFGFDRAAAISSESAEVIAATVQAFGQEDDITVVALSLTGAGIPA